LVQILTGHQITLTNSLVVFSSVFQSVLPGPATNKEFEDLPLASPIHSKNFIGNYSMALASLYSKKSPVPYSKTTANTRSYVKGIICIFQPSSFSIT
jgi:hypothetical protein